MKFFITLLCVAAASSAHLDNTYLPPNSARTAGGSGSFLAAPLSGVGAPLSNSNALFSNSAAAARQGDTISTPAASYGVPASAYSGPVAAPVPILRLNNDNNGEGSYRFDYETANHISAQESGHLKNADTSEVQGSFSYQSPDGQTISVNYVADENGFRATGDHIPTPPPVPEGILKSLALNAAEEAKGIIDNGQYQRSSDVSGQNGGITANNQYLPPTARQGYRY